MNQISLTLLGGGLALVIWSSGGQGLERTADLQSPDPGGPGMVRSYTETDSDETIRAYCVRCHNERMLRGNLSLESFEMSASHREGQTAEKMIRKHRAGMMPPPAARRPAGETRRGPYEILPGGPEALEAAQCESRQADARLPGDLPADADLDWNHLQS